MVVPPYDIIRLDYVLAWAGAVFGDPVPVSLLPTSFGICVVLGFVLTHKFVFRFILHWSVRCFFMRLLTVWGRMAKWSIICWLGGGCVTTLSRSFLTSWQGCLSASPGSSLLPLFPFALSSSLRSELLSGVALLSVAFVL